VTLLALLELYKQGLVELRQAVSFGELSAAWTGPEDGSVPDWSGASEWDHRSPGDEDEEDQEGGDQG
jgi:hypothetical protein